MMQEPMIIVKTITTITLIVVIEEVGGPDSSSNVARERYFACIPSDQVGLIKVIA